MAIDLDSLAAQFGGVEVPRGEVDLDALAAQYGGVAVPAEEPGTTLAGVAGAATRGLALPAAGAVLGAAMGAPIAGVGAIPGAVAGAGAATLAGVAGDPIVGAINSMFGTKYTLPTDAMEDLLTRIGVAEPRTEAERIVQSTATGMGAAGGSVAVGKALQSAAGPVTRGVGQVLASQPGLQVAGGAGAGAAGQTAAEIGAPLPVQVGASLAGGLAPAGAAAVRQGLSRQAVRQAPVAARVAEEAATPPVGAVPEEVGAKVAQAVPEQTVAQTATEAFEEVGTLARKAASGGKGSKAAAAKLADLAQVNPEAKAAADRLGMDLPFDVFSDNPQVRAAVGLTRSVAGGEAEAAWVNTVRSAINKADDVVQKFDAAFIEGRPAPGMTSQRIVENLKGAQSQLAKDAGDIYKRVDDAIPKSSAVRFPKLSETLDEVMNEVGEGGLTPQEKRLLRLAQGSGGGVSARVRDSEIADDLINEISDFSQISDDGLVTVYHRTTKENADRILKSGQMTPKEDGLFFSTSKSGQAEGYGDAVIELKIPADRLQLDDIFDGEAHLRLPARQNQANSIAEYLPKEEVATYGRLLREKNLVGKALSGKESPYGNMAAGDLKRLYAALADDQLTNVGELGGDALRKELRAANLLTAKKKALENRIVGAFGKELDGSVANLMQSAIKSASKGDAAQWNKLMKVIPADLRKETVATALASASAPGRAAQEGAFGFAEFAKLYRGLRANPPVYKQVIEALGKDADPILRDLYEISRRITDARGLVLTTGKSNQALVEAMKADGLITKVMQSSMAQRAVGAAAGSMGPVGGALMPDVVRYMSGGNKDAVKAAGKLFASDEFQKLAVEAATKPQVADKFIRRVAISEAFRNFAENARLPKSLDARVLWLQGAMQSGRQIEQENK